MQIVRDYTIELQTYHGEIVGRIQFFNSRNECEESALYSLGELRNIIQCWKAGELLGSFAIGSKLNPYATFELKQKF